MAGALAHSGAAVLCAHGGQATPGATNPRLTVSGQPTVLLSAPWTVAGCANPGSSGGPCATAVWSSGTTRVTSGGQPLVLSTGVGTCAPPPVPLTVASTQQRVTAT